MLFTISSAYFTDKIGRKIPLIIGCVGLILFSYPLFLLISSSKPVAIILGYGGLILLMAIYFGAATVTIAEIFPPHIRYTGVAFGQGLTFAIFGGTAPVVAAILIHLTHLNAAPSLSLIVSSLISLMTVFLLKLESRNIL